MRYLLAATLMTCALLSGSARAENKNAAREAFHEGTLQYDLGEFKAALAAFKKAYLNYEDPAFLFNIAQCQRQLGDKSEALRTYRVYLSKVPDARQRQQVEKIVAELQSAIDQDKAAATHPPMETMPPSPPVDGAAESGKLAVTPPTPTENAMLVGHPAPRRERPLTRKGWFWGAIAGGAVVVAGAVTLGVVLGTRHSNPIELTY